VLRALLAAGLALAAALPGAASPAAATPLACADPCEIVTNAAAYVAPVTEIAGGTTVLWRTSDTSHPTADTADGAERCFIVAVGNGVAPVPVRFDVGGDSLLATTAAGTPQAQTRTCSSASPLPAGGYALPYRCLLHPWMAGALLIDPV